MALKKKNLLLPLLLVGVFVQVAQNYYYYYITFSLGWGPSSPCGETELLEQPQQQQPQQQHSYQWKLDSNEQSEKKNTPTQPQRPPRRLILPSARNESVAICAIMKEEEAYLEEWVDFHLGIGFSEIYIYDNSEHYDLESWGTQRNHQHYGNAVKIQHFPPGRHASPQSAAYRQCAQTIQKHTKHKWILFSDVDEFLVMKDRQTYPHVVDMLQDYCPYGELLIWWRVFGTSGQQHYQPIPVTKRFQHQVPKDDPLNHHFKSFVTVKDMRLNVKFGSPHWFPLKETYDGTSPKFVRDTNGHFPNATHDRVTGGPDNVAVLHHYTFKSNREYIRKKQKGDVFDGQQLLYVKEALEGKTKWGDPIPDGSVWNDEAWQILQDVAPRYSMYNDFYDEDDPSTSK